MRVAICVNSYYPSLGGCETVARRIAEYFISHNHSVSVFTRHIMTRKEKNLNGVDIVGYDPVNPNSFMMKINKFDPEFTLIYSDVFDFFLATLSMKNVCFMLSGANRLYGQPDALKMFKNKLPVIKSIICHTAYERDYKLMHLIGADKKTQVIKIGINLEEFDSNNLERKDICGVETNDFWILNVSNFFPGKGQNHLLDIIARMRIKNITCVQVCSSMTFSIGKELEQEFIAKANRMKIKTLLLKDKPRETVVAAFKNSNVMVFPSEKESFGIVILEAMAAGIPWVASNIGIANEAKGGYCVGSAKNAKYNSIFDERLLNIFSEKTDKALHSDIGKDGRSDVENNYQWKNLLPEYEKLLW